MEAEDRAVEFLQKEGFEILCRNFRSKFGEIDIVALKDGVVNFFEVKFSKDFEPVYRITPLKLAKIIKTIDYFFMKYGYEYDYQISAILLSDSKIEILENISI